MHFLLEGLGNNNQPLHTTVDGRNPAPVDVVDIPVFIGFYTSKRWLFGISSINSLAVFP